MSTQPINTTFGDSSSESSFFDELFSGGTLGEIFGFGDDDGGDGVSGAGGFLETAVGGFTPLSFLDLLGIDYNAFLGNTIGQVLSDGFSCWNSTFIPSQVKAELGRVHAPYFQSLFQSLADATDINSLQLELNFLSEAVYTNIYMYKYLQTSANWRECSRKSVAHYLTFVQNLETQFDNAVQAIKNNYSVTFIEKTKNRSTWSFYGFDHEWHENTPTTYKVYNLKSNASFIDTSALGASLGFNPLFLLLLLGFPLTNMVKNKKEGNKLFYKLLRIN